MLTLPLLKNVIDSTSAGKAIESGSAFTILKKLLRLQFLIGKIWKKNCFGSDSFKQQNDYKYDFEHTTPVTLVLQLCIAIYKLMRNT